MTGAKLEKTKQAAMQLVDRLSPNDVFSLIVFSDDAQVLVPAQKVTDKGAVKASIEITCPDGVEPIGFIGRPERCENQRGSVTLSQFVLGQDRYVFLRCLVTRPEPEVTRVRIAYTDELDNGTQHSSTGVARIRFTDDQSVADRSVNAAVNAEKLLLLTAVAKDEAIAQADAGNYRQAARTLEARRSTLNAAFANAPAEVQARLQAETSNLADFDDLLSNGRYGVATRKSLQSQSFFFRNSK
jgi:hypothetical protein